MRGLWEVLAGAFMVPSLINDLPYANRASIVTDARDGGGGQDKMISALPITAATTTSVVTGDSTIPSAMQWGIKNWMRSTEYTISTFGVDGMSTSTRGTTMLMAATQTTPTKEKEQTDRDSLPQPLSPTDVQVLQQAFATLYQERNPERALTLLSQAIDIWTRTNQPPDEKAALFRVRGDCYSQLKNAMAAINDYSTSIQFIMEADTQRARGEPGDLVDPGEISNAFLGRARAWKSIITYSGSATTTTTEERMDIARKSADDYQQALQLLGRSEDWDTEEELIQDGIRRNPYAAWEWGMVTRWSSNIPAAAASTAPRAVGVTQMFTARQIHEEAAEAFMAIGDKAHAIICYLDAGIDRATTGATSDSSDKQAISYLRKVIPLTKGIESRDYALLQRLINKEGEARMALAALLWAQGDRTEAEQSYQSACERLDQLQDSAGKQLPRERGSGTSVPTTPPGAVDNDRLLYSIDDIVTIPLLDCSDFKRRDFLRERLGWSNNLQDKMIKLVALQVK